VPQSAATATSQAGTAAALTLILLLVTLGYLLTCWLWPYATCRRCHGTGKRRAPIARRTFGLCRRCHGDGHRLRAGRHVLNYLRDTHHRSQ
jgi:hypothetical protein